MYLDPDWRILTVGDGDFSFTRALTTRVNSSNLTGTVYDSENVLRDKYRHNGIDDLRKQHITLLFSFDVTDEACWQRLGDQRFDVVIFQFPLLSQLGSRDAFESAKAAGGLNILNRALLHQFLRNSARYALDPKGAGLCYITSKDVKPYSHWGLDHALTHHTPMHYVGEQPFDLKSFSRYKVRNVDRDKHVKDTLGITYSYALSANALSEHCTRPYYLDHPNCCELCRAGPFKSERDKTNHLESKTHKHMQHYAQLWQRWLTQYHGI
ncbi:class I SAM-dependent methyltransferase [Pseudoalteromonas sp. SSDWG2]|uniref:class I SAM-dependent methyltransferase n=1 Tax=Pseudoalteromonas sp. SSDWG2 TaxID=3139391 RepID=UPI003BA9F824